MSETSAAGPIAIGTRAKKLSGQRLANRIVRGLLRTPLLCRLVGRRLIIMYVVGRKSGRRFTVPVAYVADGDDLLVGTPFGWGRNLRTGDTVSVRYKGKRVGARVRVVSDEAGVVDAYSIMCRANRNFASFNQIGLDPAGNPDPGDLRLAWAAGARAFRLTLP